MIQLAHVATGALAGRRASGPLAALLAGIATHAAIDVIPHGEVHDDVFEGGSAVGGICILAARHGIDSPLVWGAIGGALPDIEHVLPRPLRTTDGLFPTHRIKWLHGWETKPFAIPAWLQALLGGGVIGALVARRITRD